VGRTLHRRAVERLAPRRGQRVLDVGCGTGLSFEAVEARIGPVGGLVGVELSREMLEQAERRVTRHGWSNVTLIEGAAKEVKLPGDLDAALLVLTHDIMRSREALANVVGSLRAGGRIVAAGSKRPPPRTGPLRTYVELKARRYVTTFEGFDAPWTVLAELVPDLEVEPILLGASYIAIGTRAV
jgi:demethylmenaquinone methyltransferase/2-methoxy-6-polyprenyl-1,4-benzoquinol methylase